jgi:hypothetical protein
LHAYIFDAIITRLLRTVNSLTIKQKKMKKILVIVFSLVCISAISYAQQTKTIKPFKPTAEDAAKIKTILAGMNKSSYSIEVRQSGKSTAYGSLNRADINSGVAVTSALGKPGNNAWVEEVVMKILKNTKSVDKGALVQLEAIAAKY